MCTQSGEGTTPRANVRPASRSRPPRLGGGVQADTPKRATSPRQGRLRQGRAAGRLPSADRQFCPLVLRAGPSKSTDAAGDCRRFRVALIGEPAIANSTRKSGIHPRMRCLEAAALVDAGRESSKELHHRTTSWRCLGNDGRKLPLPCRCEETVKQRGPDPPTQILLSAAVGFVQLTYVATAH
jgi:hypothetical protein